MVVSRHPVLEDHDKRGPNARVVSRKKERQRVRNANNNNEPKRDVVEENERDEDDAPFRDESAVVRGERHFWIYSEERDILLVPRNL